MQTELVEKKRWISQSRCLHALNFCMLLQCPVRGGLHEADCDRKCEGGDREVHDEPPKQ